MEQNQNHQDKKFIEIKGFEHISKTVKKTNYIISQYRTGKITPLLTFSDKLNDKIEGIYPGDQIVLAARSGVGKSACVNIIAKSLIERNSWAKLLFLYWSMEMPAYQQIVRMYSNKIGKSVKGILSSRNPLDEPSWINLNKYGEDLSTYPMFFRETPVNAEEWSNAVLNVQALYPEHTIVNIYDHIRLISKGNESTEEQRISNFMYEGVKVKNKISCINIFLSQLNRNIENPGNGDRRDIGASAPLASD